VKDVERGDLKYLWNPAVKEKSIQGPLDDPQIQRPQMAVLPKRQEMFIPLRELIPETFKTMDINRKQPKNYNDNGPLGSEETRNLWSCRATVSFLRRLFSVEFAVKLGLGEVLFVYNKTFDFLLAIIIPPVFNILIRHRFGDM